MALAADIERRIDGAPLSAHLATSVEDRPHVAPVWYGYRTGTLYVLTGGKKLENVRQNPRVAVSIERADETGVEWGVTILGHATVVEDSKRIEDAEGWIFEAYDGDDENQTEDDSQNQTEDDSQNQTDGEGANPGYALLEITIGSATLQTYD